MDNQELLEELAAMNPDAVIFDGFNAAIIGIAGGCGRGYVALYDYDLCVAILVDGGMSMDDAREYVDYNLTDAYIGEYSPMFQILSVQ